MLMQELTEQNLNANMMVLKVAKPFCNAVA
jgi:hypothetical protein